MSIISTRPCGGCNVTGHSGARRIMVVLADEAGLSEFLNPTLVAVMQRCRIGLVKSSREDLQKLFLDRGIDIEDLRSGAIARLEKGQRDGHCGPEWHLQHNGIEALELYLGRYLLANKSDPGNGI